MENKLRDLQINRDYALGVSKSELSRRFNVSRERIGQIIARYTGSRTINTKITKDIMELVNQMRKLYGISYHELALRSGSSDITIKNILYHSKLYSDNKKMGLILLIQQIIEERLQKHSVVMDNLLRKIN